MKLGKQVCLGPGHTVLDGDRAALPKGAQPHPIFGHICCSQMAGWIKMPLGREVGLGASDIVLDGNSAPLPKKGAEPTYIVAKRLDGSRWHLSRWSGPHCARWGPSSPPQKGAIVPQFSTYFYCGQKAGCFKMPLGMEVRLGPGHTVFDGKPAPPKRGTSPTPIFGQSLLWPNGRPSQLLLSSS